MVRTALSPGPMGLCDRGVQAPPQALAPPSRRATGSPVGAGFPIPVMFSETRIQDSACIGLQAVETVSVRLCGVNR